MPMIPVVSVSSALAGNSHSDASGPYTLRHSSLLRRKLLEAELELDWFADIVAAEDKAGSDVGPLLADKHRGIAGVVSQCRHAAMQLVPQQQLAGERVVRPFLFLGGDHSQAMGIWSGVKRSLPEGSSLTLLWLDAHMDAHNCRDSASGNVHGMPVQALLGSDDAMLRAIYADDVHLKADEIILCGVHSYEAVEQQFLQRRQVRVFYAEDMLAAVCHGAFDDKAAALLIDQILLSIASGQYLGVSLDLDVLDPQDMPAVSCRETGGLSVAFVLMLLQRISQDHRFIGAEIAEFTPNRDASTRSEALIAQLLIALYGGGNKKP